MDENDETTTVVSVCANNSDTTNNTECMICMEEMLPSSLVSWSSRRTGCGHAYHKDCIREWLLRHSECPYCRQVMLPIDRQYTTSAGITQQANRTPAVLQRLTTERIQRQNTTQYCQIHGVVTVVATTTRDCCPNDDDADDDDDDDDAVKDHLEVTNTSTTSTIATTTTTTTTATNSPSLQTHVTQILLGQHEDHLSGMPTEPPLPFVDDKSRPPRMTRRSRPHDDGGIDHHHHHHQSNQVNTHSSSLAVDVEAQDGLRGVGTDVNIRVHDALDPERHTQLGSYHVH